jgi:AraC family transcriptional regulator
MDYREHIQRSIDFIESHLGERITVENLAAREGFSACHYYRVFAAYVGLPVMGYVRKRRLEHAASRLAQGGKVLDIALDFGFESHAGFTHAFQRAYGAPPERYRLHATPRPPRPVSLVAHLNHHLTGGIVMEPRIVTRPAFKVAGYVLRTTSVEGENHRAIPAFWQDYMKNHCESLHKALTPVSHAEYGLCMEADMETGEFNYVIGLEMPEGAVIPEGLYTATVPAATYAVFTTPPSDGPGFVSSIQNTWGYIYEEWFPESGYEYAPGCADYELYDERCMPESGKQIDIAIPVVKK